MPGPKGLACPYTTHMAKKKLIGGGVLHDQLQSLKPVHFDKVLVYSLCGEPSLTVRDTCGNLVDKLMSICAAGPEFLCAETCRRYLHLLPNFKNFVFPIRYPTNREILVANEPIAAIRRAMGEWVFSFFSDEHHPILPSYSLDLTEFIARMVRGQQRTVWSEEGRPRFEVKPLVKIIDQDYGSLSLDTDKKFKADFTRSNRLHHVVCRVPANASVKYQNEVIFRPGQEFIFFTGRCHLSSGIYDYVHAYCSELYQPNLQDDFEFFGEIAAPRGDNTVFCKSRVPANWVTAAVSSENVNGQLVEARLPVPFSD